jgi:ABC-2 type transport system permease protein
MATMFFNMPAMLLSGFMFPIENMPQIFQYLTYLNPLRYFLIIIRGIFLKGSGFDILWPQMAALLALGVIIILLSALRFRKRLS